MASIDKINVKGDEYVINEGRWNELEEHNTYSTNEVDTGKKWIDGKTIYRKYIDIGSVSSGINKEVPHKIDSISNIVSTIVSLYYPDRSTFILPRVGFSNPGIYDQGYNTNFYITRDNIVIQAGSKSNYAGGYCVIEYTKE